jgi:phage-related protein
MPGEKPLFWVSSAKADLLEFPDPCERWDWNRAQCSPVWGQPPRAKPWEGEGPGVLEAVEDFRGDTFRAVYTVRFEGAVYVLHAFQKKSRRGSKTAITDIELIGKRLRAAQEDYETRFREK